MGHMKQERQGLQSTTKPKKSSKETSQQSDVKPETMNTKDEFFPASNIPNIKNHEVIYSLTTVEELKIAYTDLTGRFPVQSSRGNNYILVAYHPDANAILVAPLKNRTAPEITKTWTKLGNH